jgi:hypothetical protein
MAKQKQQQEELPQELPQAPQVEEPREEQVEPERLSRKECAQRVIAEIDGDCTLNELAEKADKLFVAGRGGDADHSDTDTAAWHIQKILETLEGVGLVTLSWECVIHPNVPKVGLPSKNGK